MSALEIGTRVKVVSVGQHKSSFEGQDGVVAEHRQGFLPIGVRLRFHSQPTWFAEAELQVITYG